MTAVVGIEIGADAVRGVVVDAGARCVLRCAQVVLQGPGAEGGAPGTVQALRALRRKLRPGGARAAVTADIGVVVSRVTLPFDDARRVAEVAAFQVEDRLPFEVTGWITDHAVARKLESGVELLVFSARRRDVEELLEALLSAGLYPAAVVPRGVALAALAVQGEAQGARAVVWVDATQADMAVTAGADLALARAVPLPGEAEEDAGDPAEAAARQVRIALLAAGATARDCPTYVGGRGRSAARVRDLLAAEPLDSVMPTSDAAQGGGEAAVWAPAAGAALSLLRPRPVDLVRAMRGPALVLRASRRAMTVFLIVAIVAGAAFLATEVRGALAAGQAVRKEQEDLRSVWQELYPGEAMPSAPTPRIKSDLAAATGQQAGAPAAVDALPRLNSVIQALPKDAGLQVTGFRVVRDAVVLHCAAGSLAAADGAVKALQAALKASVSAQNPESLGSGEHTFDIQVRWKQTEEGSGDE